MRDIPDGMRKSCPTCGALPCDHVLNPADDPTRKLLSEGLDLCARGRKLDQVEGIGATPWLWVQEQYEKDLSVWEDRARKALS